MLIRKVYTKNNDYLEVSDIGDIYHNGAELRKLEHAKTGYLYVNNQNNTYLVHRLVASAFIMPLERGDRTLQVHHINGDKKDNRVENLKVMRMEEHQRLHKQKYSSEKKCEICGKIYTPHKTKRKRSKTCSYECWRKMCKQIADSKKIPINQFDLDGNLIKKWDSARDIQNILGYFESNINKCCKGHIKTYKGFVWKYVS